MRKLLFLSAVVVAIGLTSCKKEYTCECVSTETVSGATTTSSVTIKGKKDEAKEDCEGGSGESSNANVVCEIK
jgi:hypothetical protein